ncbi:MAG: MFS transporter [Proteobacteria bacterium]|nr:MFS transporter [Pseudomonadota bacterium]
MTSTNPAFSGRHRWKVLAAGVVANAAFSTAFSGIPMTAVLMRSGYRLEDAALGLVLGLMGLGIAVSELPWGLLTDKWGDRPVLLMGLGATAAALFAMALLAAPTPGHVPELAWLGAGLLLVGVLGGSVNGASGRAVMRWFADGERGLAMSIRQTAVPLGGGLGALLLPMATLRFGFGVMYGLLGALCLVGAALVAAWVHEPPASGAPTAANESPAGQLPPLQDARVWRLVAGIGILCAPQFALLSFGTVFLHDFGRVGLVVISAAMTLVQVGAMVMRVWSGRWTDRWRNRPAYLRACSVLVVVMFAALALFTLLLGEGMPAGSSLVRAALLALMVTSGICVSAWHGVAYTELATLSGAARAGTALGMANTAVFAVCFVTPLAIPHLRAAHGWSLVWLAASACAVVALPLLAPAARRVQPGATGHLAPPALSSAQSSSCTSTR